MLDMNAGGGFPCLLRAGRFWLSESGTPREDELWDES